MCIGIPMQVQRIQPGGALCQPRTGEPRLIDISLVGAVEPGTWLMTFLDAARAVISETEARQSMDALDALEQVMRGETSGFDHLFADLIGREPALPAHLIPSTQDTPE